MSFLRPIQTGDLIGFFTPVTEIGKTSIKDVVEGWIEYHHDWEKLTETTMVFIAIDRGTNSAGEKFPRGSHGNKIRSP